MKNFIFQKNALLSFNTPDNNKNNEKQQKQQHPPIIKVENP